MTESALMIDHQGYASDPGSEVLDLPDELRLADTDPLSWLDVPAHVVTPDLARLTGHATDYEWCPWLADVLRAAGCSVVELEGWQTRGRPRSAGPFTPRGLMIHHDGSKIGPSPAMARFIGQEGRPAAGIPAPLAQLWICAGCNGAHKIGTWHVLAAGRANHAGIGAGYRMIGRDLGNSLTLGVEMDNTTGEPTDPAMYGSLVRGSAALMRRMRSSPAGWLAGHKEYAVGRKVDPDDIRMASLRIDVAARMNPPKPPAPPTAPVKPYEPSEFPGRSHFRMGGTCPHGHIRQLRKWLRTAGYLSRDAHHDLYDNELRAALKKFQKSRPELRGDADGMPGPITWRLIERVARRELGRAEARD